jgi:UvrD-like helicase C-terminal domain/Nuclease-related domain/AAA domain
MAVLIPSLSSCVSRMTTGERRLAERLEHKLEDDYLLWYDVPIGPRQAHPDFVVLHPRRGLLVLEVKDWRLDTVQEVDRMLWRIAVGGKSLSVGNPFEQARHYAHQVVDQLRADPQLVWPDGPQQGKLTMPWSFGVVLTHITRRQFEQAHMGEALDPSRVICADEMTESVESEAFQQRLWAMFPFAMRGALSQPQIDRIRWLLFPQIRVGAQAALWEERDEPLPDLLRVMDLQQEQLARSLSDGHRVIHGVAGSGKTMILGYRAEQLAKSASAGRPVLVLCYNEPLAVQLAEHMAAKGLGERVLVRHFHRWCRQQLVDFGQTLPAQGPAFFDELVDAVIRGVDRRQIPSGQYLAVLIDEGHDFRPEWLRLVTQMVDPSTNSLLLLYDDAQSIYERRHTRQFSFKSVGIQAQGRTTILRINYRNTRQILETANVIAAELLDPDERDDDGVPLLRPLASGREGAAPLIVRLPNVHREGDKLAELLAASHAAGRAWSEMVVLCRRHQLMAAISAALRRRQLPHQVRSRTGEYEPQSDTIKIMTMHACKGLEFPLAALAGIGQLPESAESAREDARLFYVAATRATQQLIITVSGDGEFGRRLAPQP